ncbi:MAG: hypothetical protein ACPHL6_08310, partial [Rubripirellula sp.]
MSEKLSHQIAQVEKRYRRLRLIDWLSLTILLVGITSWLLNRPIAEQRFSAEKAVPTLIGILAIITCILKIAASRHRIHKRFLATQIESHFPDLDQQLLTALDVPPTARSYLETEVIRQVVSHGQANDWKTIVSKTRMRCSLLILMAASLFCGVSFIKTLSIQPSRQPITSDPSQPDLLIPSVVVEPGDVEIEAGTQIVITARYESDAPDQANLLVTKTDGEIQTYTMVRNLDDPVLGIVLPNINGDFKYQVYDAHWSSETYHASVYTHPVMLRSDATLTYPEYTNLSTKRIEDTIRVAAVEGSKVRWDLYLNKEVQKATLSNQESGIDLQLVQDPTEALRYTTELTLEQTQKLSLELIDHAGRKNKYPPELVARLVKNTPPKLTPTLAGDSTVSPLEEFPVAAEVNDDFGILQFGLTYTFANTPPKDVVLGG